MNSKQLFQKDKELCDQWSAVCHAQWFEVVMVYAMTGMTEGPVTAEQMEGAKMLRDILMNLADDDAMNFEEPTSGLKHDVLAEIHKLRVEKKEKK